jgi:uncharacterized protein DUF3313
MPTISRIRNTSSLGILAAASLLFVGCTTVTTQSFRFNKNSEIESSQIATGADFRKYDRLTADGMGIFFPEDAEPSQQDQQRTRQIFRSAFLKELQTYEIVQNKGPTTLMVKSSLIDYRKSSGGDALQVRRDLRDLANPGSMIFLMELVDSNSGAVLARAADSASVPVFGVGDSIKTDWDAVETAAKRWAALFGKFLDENLNK